MNREIRVTSHSKGRLTAEPRITHSAFTLIELVVAIGILGMMFLFAGVIFRTGIETHRTAGANAEIMQKLRAITDQLNRDFKGIRKNSPILVYPDRVTFFANGDFQSIRRYGPTGNKTIAGNIANIFYGPAEQPASKPQERILTRRQTILTADTDLSDPNALGEYFNRSLYEWRTPPRPFPSREAWAVSPVLDPNNLVREDLVMYMAQGVDEFAVGCAAWDDITGKFAWNEVDGRFVDPVHNELPVVTRALKFSFKLYDSKGILENGRKFTHIVYIGD